MNTTPPPTDCEHEYIQTWRDPERVPRMWSCVKCAKKFEPIGPWMERITALEAENARLREALSYAVAFKEGGTALARTALENKHA